MAQSRIIAAALVLLAAVAGAFDAAQWEVLEDLDAELALEEYPGLLQTGVHLMPNAPVEAAAEMPAAAGAGAKVELNDQGLGSAMVADEEIEDGPVLPPDMEVAR
eukprot:TRINITY_DN65012_c0_g1_i1.p1 TRINITY_DN65012_c0_g1~~TRINITY_DN65012_c0_g1_i1.p1  ORF type:complete len:105 (-),score=30.96 TRINITY_DN65012_c0_g1_i1:86-400(-)